MDWLIEDIQRNGVADTLEQAGPDPSPTSRRLRSATALPRTECSLGVVQVCGSSARAKFPVGSYESR